MSKKNPDDIFFHECTYVDFLKHLIVLGPFEGQLAYFLQIRDYLESCAGMGLAPFEFEKKHAMVSKGVMELYLVKFKN